MSHFTEVKTSLTDLEKLCAAAKRLGLEVVQKDGVAIYAQGFMDNQIEAEAIIKTGSRYDIGVCRDENGGLYLSADWELLEKVKEIKQSEWVGQVSQQYALLSIEETAAEQGLSINEPIIGDDGSIEVTVSEW